MDLLMHEVLRKIQSGLMSFKPGSSSPDDMRQFQSVAKAIVHAHNLGYIERIAPRREFHSGNGYYAVILINGGLTYKGEQLLQQWSGKPTPLDESIDDLLGRIPGHSIREKWEKALSRRITDPSGAITAARALLETTLKWIIEQRGGKPTENNKELFNKAIDALGLVVKGKPIEKTIVGLDSIIWGIGDMRNKHGDAHGAASDAIPPTKSEAGFCVNLAGSVALYLLEEFEAGCAPHRPKVGQEEKSVQKTLR